MKRSLHPGAWQDAVDAMDFYTQHAGAHVAARFLDEFERVVRLLMEHPGFDTPVAGGRRVFPLKAFPYSVVYQAQSESLRILIVRHQSRKPSFASNRH